jgi:hypothetical protein
MSAHGIAGLGALALAGMFAAAPIRADDSIKIGFDLSQTVWRAKRRVHFSLVRPPLARLRHRC